MPRIERAGASIIALALGALALAGCLGDDCDCPELTPIRVAEGILRPRDATGAFSATERLVLDRGAGVVTLTTTRDGHVVVERWRITASAIRP